jgi:predicted PurR-regulated permease PerM
LGVPYPILMAVLTGVISLIPSVGGLLASLIVAVPCLIFGSTKLTDMSPLVFTVIVTVINIVITQVSYNFILLPIIGKAVKLPISIVLIAVLSGFAMNSILFAFLVVPVLASFRILIEYIVAKIRLREPFPDEPMVPAPGVPGSVEALPTTAT